MLILRIAACESLGHLLPVISPYLLESHLSEIINEISLLLQEELGDSVSKILETLLLYYNV